MNPANKHIYSNHLVNSNFLFFLLFSIFSKINNIQTDFDLSIHFILLDFSLCFLTIQVREALTQYLNSDHYSIFPRILYMEFCVGKVIIRLKVYNNFWVLVF